MTGTVPGERGSASQDDRPRFAQFVPGQTLTPLTITLSYLVFGFCLLFVSDVLLVQYLEEPLLSQMQAFKGGVEVLLTAGFVFVLTNQRERQRERMQRHLERERRELELLHRVLRHNLRNDLSVILAQASLLAEQFDDEPPECARIRSVVERMQRYTDQAKRIKQVTDGGDTKTFALDETLAAVVDGNEDVTEAVDVETGRRSVSAEANYMLPETLSELVTNAVVHNDGSTPTVSVRARPVDGTDDTVEVGVSDDGPGMPVEEREPLHLDREDQMAHLSGMGL